jgi:hypothetical protein
VPTPVRTWLPPALGALAFVLVLVASATVAGNWALRTVAMSALVERIEVSEQAMGTAQQAVVDALADFESTGDATALDSALREAASSGLAGVTAAGAEVETLAVPPWQRDLVEARTAYLAHNRAWRDYLAAAAADPTVLGDPPEDIARTWLQAEPLVRAAVPMPDLLDLADRVSAIFADEAPGADST